MNLLGIFTTCEKLRAFERNQNLESSCLMSWTPIVYLWWPCWNIFLKFSVANMAEIEHNANFKQWFNVFLITSEASPGYESKAYRVSNHNLKLQSKKLNRTRNICNFPTQGWGDTHFTCVIEVRHMYMLFICIFISEAQWITREVHFKSFQHPT